MGKKLLVVLILLFSVLLAPIFIQKADALSCKNQRPEIPPVLISAEAKDRSVVLTWQPAPEPITHYLVAYARDEINLEYGNPNVGKTTTYSVTELENGVKYYFKVRGENGCKPGKFSNKLSAIPGFPNRKSVTSTGPKQPNLSIYKTVAVASASATPTEEFDDEKAPPPAPLVAAAGQSLNCSTCVGLQLLGIEMMLLLAFFYLSKRNLRLKQIYSVLIPLLVYLAFYKLNGFCPNDSFWCKYFIQLSIIVFMAFIILYKNRYINVNFKFAQSTFTYKTKTNNKVTKRKRKK
ncbi:MAG: fibronectin type III domain-containing protein [Candidatus Levybacteria bacterium]|nr:fibronectin type III domain-containing protein [Candidatus Levybacteria bacterium]